MTYKALMRVGLAGSLITALCCFTPILVWILPAFGLAAALAWLDQILFPVLAVFLAITVFAWTRMKRP